MYECHVSIMHGMKLPDIGIGYPLMVLYSHTFHNNLSIFENTVKLQPSKKRHQNMYLLVVENTTQLCTTLDYHCHIHIKCMCLDQVRNADQVLLFGHEDQYTPQIKQQLL
jgi:hypothetical protein